MKLNIMIAVLLVALTFKSYSELINLNPDPDGEPWIVGGYKYTEKAEEIYNALPRVEITEEGRNTELKGMVDNSIGTAPGMPGYYFRPVFDQGGYGNCVHAAVIGYAFTYEINWLRKIQTPATEIENQYPINYSYNYWWWGTDGSSIGTEMHTAFDTAIEYGIPSSVIWEEVTGDSLTGNAIQWMSGYDKYYNAMNNRGLERVQFSDLSDPTNNFQNFNDLKIYLANHGIGDIVGGLAVFAFDMENARFRKIPPEYYMGEKAIIFSTDNDFDHAMTIVGYDDNVAYDFVVEYYTDDTGLSHKIPPSNEEWKWDSENHCIIKTPKPMTEWEVGALKIANSWGEGWYHKIDEGFIYLPYRLVAQGKTSEVSAIVPVNDNTFPETQIVDLTYKVSLSHDLRNKMANSIAMTVDPNSELGDPYVPEKQFITSQAKKGGPYPMQGINSNPIEFGLDVTEFYRDEFKSPSDLYYPKKYFFIIDDITSAQPAIPNEILSFELYDHRNNNELHIRCSENNKVITPDDRTSMSIIYDIFNNNEDFNNNEEIIHISDNVGFSLPAGISGRRTLSVANNSRLYFHNTSFDSRIPFGLPATDRPSIVIDGSAEFIGFDESTEDFINAEDTDIIINSILYLENCDLIMGESSVLVLNDNAEIIVTENSELVISPNSNITFGAGSNIVVKSGSTLKLSDDITIPVGSQIDLEPGANLVIDGNIRITGNIQMADGVNIDILDNSSLGLQLSQVTILAGTSLKLGVNAKLIIENGSNLIFEDGAVVELAEGAEIIIKNKGKLITNNNTTDRVTFASNTGSTGNWVGITCEGGSTLELNGVKISGATTAVSGIHFSCFISNSVFENCNNGINLVECDNYTITLNKFTGINTGTGVSTTVSGGTLSGNTIVNFSCGVNCILSAPTISNNNICNNLRYGVQISGHNALPHLVNLTANLDKFNNTISNNGAISTSPWIFPYAQIGIKPFGNVYMAFGMNNIYSGQINTIPQIPCISIARYVPVNQSQSLLHNELINAPRNYWGSDAVTIDFFEMLHMHEIYGMITVDVDYNINFTPWANELYTGTGTPTYSSNEPPSTESIQLSNAMMLEAKEKYNACIKQYEHVIKKYIDTPEYYVALARLPYVYLKAGLDTDPLINTYDEGLLSENTSRKKFFKEMKIATHIKSKKYDSAIALAEEMKAEAQCEDEILLADIDIAICNIMKEAENEGKGGSTNSNLVINELLSKLTGDDEKSEPENITENILPTECKLFQNYPNPFNPVTEIKFDLSKTAKIKLCVYNINGQLISELANGTMNAGQHYVDFDGSKLNSGIYYYTLETDGMAITKKMILMK